MRLVIDSRGSSAAAGLNRYNGRGIYSSIGRKAGLRKVKKDEADADDLDKKFEGKGVDAVDSNIDKPSNVESEEESSIETASNSTEEKQDNDDRESSLDNKEEDINGNKEDLNEDLNEKVDDLTQTAGFKRKYPPSIVDFLINNNPDDTSIPTKLQRLESSIPDWEENSVSSLTESQPSITNHDSRNNNERMSEKSLNHHLSLITPTEGKRWPQKKCVYCRRKYGIRNDTRYFCMECKLALCKEPCFSDYHCDTSSGMPPKATT